MSVMIDEAYLYKYMPLVEQYLMSRIPPEEELDHVFSHRFERKMKKLIKDERRTPTERKVYRGLKIAFAALAVVVLLVFGSAMSVKAYRFRIVEFFVEVFTELTSYSVKEELPDVEELVPVEPSYVPEGFVESKCVEDDSGYYLVYENIEGEQIHYEQMVVGAVGIFWDTEKSDNREVKVKGQKISIVEEIGVYTLYWKDDWYVYRIQGVGDINVDALLKMARSVIKR